MRHQDLYFLCQKKEKRLLSPFFFQTNERKKKQKNRGGWKKGGRERRWNARGCWLARCRSAGGGGAHGGSPEGAPRGGSPKEVGPQPRCPGVVDERQQQQQRVSIPKRITRVPSQQAAAAEWNNISPVVVAGTRSVGTRSARPNGQVFAHLLWASQPPPTTPQRHTQTSTRGCQQPLVGCNEVLR